MRGEAARSAARLTAASRKPAAGSTIEGQWIRLTPLAAYTDGAVHDLMFRLGLRPEMVAPEASGRPAGSRFGEPAVIASRATGEMLGILNNVELGDYPGVAGLVIYVDEQRSRAGYAMRRGSATSSAYSRLARPRSRWR